MDTTTQQTTIYLERIDHTWDLHTTTPHRRVAAVVAGPMEVTEIGFGVPGARLADGQVWSLRQVVELARQGKLGLSIVEGR